MVIGQHRAIELALELQHVSHWRRFKRARLWRELIEACAVADAARVEHGASPDAPGLLEILVEWAELER